MRVLLLYLADHMRADRTVSIPQSQIAEALGVTHRRVRERLASARDLGLLDVVRQGRPRVTAMYQGLFPSVSDAAHGRPIQTAVYEAVERPLETAFYAAHGGPPNSKRSAPFSPVQQSPTEGSTVTAPRRPTTSQEEDPEGRPARSAGRETAEGGDVVSIADRETRRALIDAIQENARLELEWADGGIPTDAWTEANDWLQALLNELEDGLGDWANMRWSFPKAVATNRYLAGAQLNKLISTYRKDPA